MSPQGINPQFPHYVTVTRTDVNGEVNPPVFTTRVILSGVCRNLVSKRGGTGISNGVFISDYFISMPYNEVDIHTGDFVEVKDRVSTINGVVVQSYNGNLGCVIWYNRVDN